MAVAAWILVWNLLVVVRFAGFMSDPLVQQIGPARGIGVLMLDQTTWALATLLGLKLALRARHEPLRDVAWQVALVALPIVVFRYWATHGLSSALGWNRPASLRQFLYTSPFHLLVFWSASVFGFLIVYMERERQQLVTTARLQGQLAEARLQALRLQLNPHFLFNALNSIAGLIHSDARKAAAAIGALSDFLRGSVGSEHGDEISMDEELRLLDAYLEIETLRFDWLTVERDIPEEARGASVPAFSIQLLVENAIRHGLAPRAAPGRIDVRARREGNQLVIRVSDDGVGLSARRAAQSLGIGLSNMRARLAQLYGSDAGLVLSDNEGGGATATIRLPFRPRATRITTGEFPVPARR